MYSDTPLGRDPDAFSKTLRKYHRAIWSKQLPCGQVFELSADSPGTYLRHCSGLGEFSLSSDSIGATYKNVKAMRHIIDQVPSAEVDDFFSICSTIGAYIVFPSNRIDRKPTINGARGLNFAIRDRFDLTLECIRRHYQNESSPLSEPLKRYANFFAIFENFEIYCDFFLLQDLLNPSTGPIRFFIPFDDFRTKPLPENVSSYRTYRDGLVGFVEARNARIKSSFASGF